MRKEDNSELDTVQGKTNKIFMVCGQLLLIHLTLFSSGYCKPGTWLKT